MVSIALVEKCTRLVWEYEARFKGIQHFGSLIPGFFPSHIGDSCNKVFQWRVSQGILNVFDWMMAVEARTFPWPFFSGFSRAVL